MEEFCENSKPAPIYEVVDKRSTLWDWEGLLRKNQRECYRKLCAAKEMRERELQQLTIQKWSFFMLSETRLKRSQWPTKNTVLDPTDYEKKFNAKWEFNRMQIPRPQAQSIESIRKAMNENTSRQIPVLDYTLLGTELQVKPLSPGLRAWWGPLVGECPHRKDISHEHIYYSTVQSKGTICQEENERRFP